MRAIIVDDEAVARKALRERCDAEPDIEILGEYADTEGGLAAIRELSPEVVFLDIKMGKASGMELAQSLEVATAPVIVFVTAFDRHALEAFEVNAADYLLKPFDRPRFQAMLARVRERLAARSSEGYQIAVATLVELQRMARASTATRPRLLAELGGKMQMVDVAQIEFISADGNYVVLTVGKESLHARSTLAQAEEAMRSQPMLQINRSCIVNVNHVQQVTRTARGDFVFVLTGGSTVSSSERYRQKVRAHMEKFLMGGA
jgi:two-component system, LytTR family, response regulator